MALVRLEVDPATNRFLWLAVAPCPKHGAPTCDEFALMFRSPAQSTAEVFFASDFLVNTLPRWTMPRCEGCVEELTRDQFLKNVTRPVFVPVAMADRPVWRCEQCWKSFTPPPSYLAHPNGLVPPRTPKDP
jgi:hypothetical protein